MSESDLPPGGDAETAAPIVNLETARRSRRRPSGRPKVYTGPDWLEGAIVDDRGRTLPVLRNVTLALRSDPAIAESFAFDELEGLVIVKRELPLAEGAERNGAPTPRPLTDADATQTQEWLQWIGLPKVGVAVVYQAIELRARERAFHPIRDYLNGLEWDRKPRIGKWLTKYLGAESRTYTDAIGAMFLTAAVARIFKPGCQADYMLILEGPQGLYKSTACRILGGEWFSDSMPELREGKEVSLSLRGKWIIELAELSALSRADADTLKTFISRREERYRPPYGRGEIVEPRHCVYIGTTNRSTYLKDETGGRRFWPAIATRIDLKALEDDRDQLWAEAAAAYRRGDAWWPSPEFERDHIRAEQEARREVDAWQEPIAAYVASRQSVTPGQVAKALGIATARAARADSNRIAAVLIALGWRRSDKKDSAGNYPYLKE